MSSNLAYAEKTRLLDLSLVNGDKMALMAQAGSDFFAGSEVVGGSYTRQTIAYAAASGPNKVINADLVFSALSAGDIQGWAIYSSTGTLRWRGLFNTQRGKSQESDDTIQSPAHGLANGQKIVFAYEFTPPGLIENTTYFVVSSTTNSFKVAATLGGSAIDITLDWDQVEWGKVKTVASGNNFKIPANSMTLSFGWA